MEKIVVIGVAAIVVLIIGAVIYSAITYKCVKSHWEKQYQAPAYWAPKDGGVSVPISNGRWVNAEVCEQWDKR